MNIYGKKMSAYFNLFDGLRALKQGDDKPYDVEIDKVDELVGELVEWAEAIRGNGTPEVGGEGATESLAVIKAGILSVKERRVVDVAEVLALDD
jgi:predicted dehydrogenase